MKNGISILLGAGASLSAGMPSTDDITQTLLTGKDKFGRTVTRETDGNYYLSDRNERTLVSGPYSHKKNVIKFLNYINTKYYGYYKDYFNYEELYFLINELSNLISGELKNFIYLDFLERYKIEINEYLKSFSDFKSDRNLRINELIRESLNYIRDTVHWTLKLSNSTYNHLRIISKMYENNEFRFINIFTLNHDTIIENFLQNMNYNYSDGFEKTDCEIRIYNRKLLKSSELEYFRYIKIHGSLDWYRIREQTKGWSGECYAQLKGVDRHRPFKILGKTFDVPIVKPEILIGTHNKLSEYTNEMFLDMFYLFYDLLLDTNTLIISGYSFGDQGINSRIINWLYKDYSNRKFVLIYPEDKIENTKNNSSGAIFHKWDIWERDQKIKLIPKGFENITIEELEEKVNEDYTKK